MAVEVDAVDTHLFGIGSRLTAVPDNHAALHVRQRTAGNLRDVEIGIHGCRNGRKELGQQALGIAHTAQTGGQLNKDAASPGVDTLRQITPAHKVGAGCINSGEVGEISLLGDGGINMMADGHKAGRQQANAAFCTGEEILQHFVVGPPGFLGHLAVAHRRHHHAVFHGHAVDLDGGKEFVIRIQVLGHASRTASPVFVVRFPEPAAIGVNQFLNQGIVLQWKFLTFCFHF